MRLMRRQEQRSKSRASKHTPIAKVLVETGGIFERIIQSFEKNYMLDTHKEQGAPQQ